jgi:hypothetical protein
MTYRLLPLAALLLALGLAAPARATTVNATNSPFIVDATNSPFNDRLDVVAGGELEIVSGGSVSRGLLVSAGTATISGGSVSGGVVVGDDGTLTVVGCGLTLSPAGQLTGILADGTLINIPTQGELVLDNQCTASTLAGLVRQFVTDPVVQGLLDKLNAIATARNPHAKAGAVGAFVNQVNAQTGKSITPQQAVLLLQIVRTL